MKRYKFLPILILYAILLISFGCVKAFRYTMSCAEIKSDQSFKFFITSDIHHLSKEIYDNGKAFKEFLQSGDGKLLQYSNQLIDALICDIKTEHPDFLIVAGDLTCNGELKSHLELAEKFKAIEALGTCVFVVPGNHDVENPWAKQYTGDEASNTDSLTRDEYLKLYAPFGYNEAVSKDPNSLSYLAMPAEDTWFLMLDSSDYTRNKGKQYPEQGGALPAQTLKWIEQCADLAKENNARIIAVMHHSLIDHSKILNLNYTLDNNDELLQVFDKCGIEIVLTGHIHLQDIKTEKYDGKMFYDIATSSLSVYPHQYGRMEYTPDKGFNYRTVMLDMGRWAKQVQTEDGFLLNFKAYSADFFINQCSKMHQRCLAELDGLSDKDKNIVLETIDRMNMMYFAGYRNEALDEIVNTEGFKILEKASPCFTKDYAMSILKDQRTDNNRLYIPIYSRAVQNQGE